MTIEEETKPKSNESNTDEGIRATLSLIKKVLFSLIIVTLVLSTAFNLYLSYQNRRLNEVLDLYTTQLQKLSMRDQTLDRLFRDLTIFSEDNPELRKLLEKYHILPDKKENSGKDKKADSELEGPLDEK